MPSKDLSGGHQVHQMLSKMHHTCVAWQGHQYRNVLDLRHGASTSLIELEFASHTGADADVIAGVPPGLPFYTLKAQLRELELVFLNRFLQVLTIGF